MNTTSLPGASQNRHIVDQLADVHEHIRILEERESQLRAEIMVLMGPANSMGGDEYIASIKATSRKGGLDEAAMKAAGIDTDRFRKPSSSVTTLRLERRSMDVA